jgi:16S rRNA (uracil1498-N3)-methyltransferase
MLPGQQIDLPAAAARHVQVLRMQPGQRLTLFNGGLLTGSAGDANAPDKASALAHLGGEFEATIVRMGRSEVQVEVGAHRAIEREASRQVHLAVGMPANERMDWLVEKATELGAASLQPLMTERSVLKLKGERAEKKLQHWRGIAIAACEQSGRNRLPVIHDVATLSDWLNRPAPDLPSPRLLLSLRENSLALHAQSLAHSPMQGVLVLCGPEGGLSPAEEDRALSLGFVPTRLGAQVLRTETAALAALAALSAINLALTLNG